MNEKIRAGFKDGSITGLGKLIACAFFAKEQDLNITNNVFVKEEGGLTIVNIDGGCCNPYDKKAKHKISGEVIDNFLNPKAYRAENCWLNIEYTWLEELYDVASIVREFLLTLAIISSLPDYYLANFVGLYTDKRFGAEPIRLLKLIRDEIRIGLLASKRFETLCVNFDSETAAEFNKTINKVIHFTHTGISPAEDIAKLSTKLVNNFTALVLEKQLLYVDTFLDQNSFDAKNDKEEKLDSSPLVSQSSTVLSTLTAKNISVFASTSSSSSSSASISTNRRRSRSAELEGIFSTRKVKSRKSVHSSDIYTSPTSLTPSQDKTTSPCNF